MAAELTALVFALEREVMYLRRQLGAMAPVRAAPCPAWRAGDVMLVVTGMGPAAAARAVAWLLTQGVTRVLSGGFCGALVEGLAVGEVAWPAWVSDDNGSRAVLDAGSCGRGGVFDAPERASPGLVSVPTIVGGAAERAALAARSGAHIADMETATVARLCHAAGVPVTSLRVVSDAVGRPPHPALVAALAGERVRAWPLARAILRRPWLMVELLRLARDSRRAARRLAEAVRGWLRVGY